MNWTFDELERLYAAIPPGQIREVTAEERRRIDLALAAGLGLTPTEFGYAHAERPAPGPKANWSAEGF